MANIMDYLDWRGDLPLTVSPFNEVDGLILAELSFINFEGIVPPPELGRGVPLRDAAGTYFSQGASPTSCAAWRTPCASAGCC